jgi:hypothetical protein
LTSKRPQRTERERRRARESVEATRRAVAQATETDAEALDVDPASALFFEFAAPLLLTASTEQEFAAASALADFVWATTHFDAQTQVLLLNQFIDEAGVTPQAMPWLLEVYGELAARKAALLGE